MKDPSKKDQIQLAPRAQIGQQNKIKHHKLIDGC